MTSRGARRGRRLRNRCVSCSAQGNRYRRPGSPGAVASDSDASGVDAEFGRVAMQPDHRVTALVNRAGKGMFRRQRIVDADDRLAVCRRDAHGDVGVGHRAALHPRAAMHVDECRLRAAILVAIDADGDEMVAARDEPGRRAHAFRARQRHVVGDVFEQDAPFARARALRQDGPRLVPDLQEGFELRVCHGACFLSGYPV